MTTQGADHEDTSVLDFQTPDRHDERAWQTMTLDGVPLQVRKPKGAFFVQLATKMGGSELAQAAAVDEVLDKVFDDESREHVRARLDDDEDDFDVEEFGAILQRLRSVWGKGRGGSASGSKSQPRKSGRRSTARSRS